MKVWAIGEVLWDVFPDQELLGGAPLNFCLNLQRLGDEATLHSAVGDDPRGDLALERMTELGIQTEGVRVFKGASTGVALVGSRADGEPTFRIPRPAAFDYLAIDVETVDQAITDQLEWLYFGTLSQMQPEVEASTTALAKQMPQIRCFYDMNLRKDQWNLPLVQRLSSLASILKLNEVEAEMLFALTHSTATTFSLEEFCHSWSSAYGIDIICVTLGPAGCAVYDRNSEKRAVERIAGYKVQVCDTVGSGDAFAAAFLHGYSRDWPLRRTAQFANALGALVASRPGATSTWTLEELALIDIRDE